MMSFKQRFFPGHLLRNVILLIIITLVLLEALTRFIWWNPEVGHTVGGKEITLLPEPIITDQQLAELENWPANDDRYIQYDPILGWSIRPNAHAQQAGVTYTANSAGIRSLREYSLEKPVGVIRIGAFGPSFTHGDEVSDSDTWQAQMEQIRPELEVMNWGVGGYGTDQAFLRYQTQGAAYGFDIVIIGFEEDNIRRNVNRFRPFFRTKTGLPLTKPVFTDDSDQGFMLVENPFADVETLKTTITQTPNQFLDMVCKDDFYCDRARYELKPLDMFYSYRFLRTLMYEMGRANQPQVSTFEDPYVQRVNFLLLKAFVTEIVRQGAMPIILIFPERTSMEAHEHGQSTNYQTALIALKDAGLPVIDLAPAFVHAKTTENAEYLDYYASDGGHYNALGNYIVGQTVLAYLCQQGILENC